MQHIADSICASTRTKNWHAALALSLTVPDICGQIEFPEWGGPRHVGKRYPTWFDAWVKDRLFRFGADGKEFPMSGADAYALRNAFLHTGVKEARPPYKLGYKLVVPTGGNLNHMGTAGAGDDQIVLYVGVEPFCMAMTEGALEWEASILQRRPDSRAQIEGLLKIVDGEVSVSFSAIVGEFVLTSSSAIR
jgi:hypothetical protein